VVPSYFGGGICGINSRIGDGGAGILAFRLQADQTDVWGLFVPLRGSYPCILSTCIVSTCSLKSSSSGYSQFRSPDAKVCSALCIVPSGALVHFQSNFLSGGFLPVFALAKAVFGFQVVAPSRCNRLQ